MRTHSVRWAVLIACLALVCAGRPGVSQTGQPTDLTGLWVAKRRLGPEVRGTLTIDRVNGAWRASIAGQTVPVRASRDSVRFQLPGGERFTGRIDARQRAIVGHWIQSRTASAVVLASCGPGCYRGEIVPLDQEFTFFLRVSRRPDGRLAAFVRNPERNLGHLWIPVRSVTVEGSNVRLLDKRDSLILPGVLRPDDVLSVYIGNRGGSYDFRRVPDTAYTNFYPRGRPTAQYTYVPPRARDDGWPVGTLEEVGIERDSIVALIQRLISAPIDSATAMQTHSLLIARHGKLVLEEYFYGEHADKPHDTRSASKAVLTALIGAARQSGIRIDPEVSVYSVLRPGATNLPSGKRAMTLEHLLTMSAGFDCDDSGDRPGDEDVLTEQDTNPNWYDMILDLDVVREPGDSAVYCSIKPHLAGGVVARLSGRPLQEMVRDLLTDPLDMRNYHLFVTPLDEVYFGGGHRFVPRDFLKFAQLYLNGGTWRGRRILSQSWIDRSVQRRFPMGRDGYGYLWWSREYPYRGRMVKAYYMVGNGSQTAMYIPALDLVIGHHAGNYADGSNTMLGQLIPRVILPAVAPGN